MNITAADNAVRHQAEDQLKHLRANDPQNLLQSFLTIMASEIDSQQ